MDVSLPFQHFPYFTVICYEPAPTERPKMSRPLLLWAMCNGLASSLPVAQQQNCAGGQCNQNNFAGFAGGIPATGLPIATGFAIGGATQNCVGSTCNQNNGRKKREAQVQNCQGSFCNQNNGAVVLGIGFPFGVGFAPVPVAVGPAVGAAQNCQGSSCNQNNGGVGVVGPSVQNCSGSSCNQNNGK